ncbi:hypothetical protein ACI2OX_12245 [Bacillus sp. N9]
MHGVGASVVNALSEWLIVTIKRDGHLFKQEFHDGGKPKTTLEKIGKAKETGTTIHFKPDSSIFSTTVYNYDLLSERLRESAFLLKGLKIELIDLRHGHHDVFHYENGIEAFVEYLNEEKDVLHPVASFEGKVNEIEVEFAFQFNDGYAENMLSFVNNVRTKDGGTHEIGARTAMTRVFNEYARRTGLLKEKEKNLEGSDIREGLGAVVSVRIPESMLQFEGQTKGKLGTSEARSAVDAVISEHLEYFLAENHAVSALLAKKRSKQPKREKQQEKHVKKQEVEKTEKSRYAFIWEINASSIKKSRT